MSGNGALWRLRECILTIGILKSPGIRHVVSTEYGVTAVILFEERLRAALRYGFVLLKAPREKRQDF